VQIGGTVQSEVGGNVNEHAGDQIEGRVAQEDGDVMNDVPGSKSTSQQW
jgi:hypothetical protein